LEERYFFTPGFPQMAHPMIASVIERLFSTSQQKYRVTLLAKTSENTLINIMKKIPSEIELSSLPILNAKEDASVEISLCAADKKSVDKYFKLFTDFLKNSKISYNLI
ncbi:MAG: competence/damage-inducible protein A, partial [Sulfurimonas sp.]|nr:competence/damage-inducible protein A [Sulfurimonas sp.]